MLKFTSIVLLTYLQLSNCYNKSITIDEYSQCKKEAIIGPGERFMSSFMKFQKFVPINSLLYGNGRRETKIKFYFQARSRFGIAFLPQPNQPQLNEPIINIQISCGKDLAESDIELNTGKTVKCSYNNTTNPMDTVYFTELQIVINKKVGYVDVFFPHLGSSAFLTCYDPYIISRIRYIGFSGSFDNVARYIYDCPV